MSVRRNIILNGLANVLAKTVRVADQLVLVPFFLSAWGAAFYGEWLTLSMIPSILAFADLGFGSSSSNAFVLSYSKGDIEKAGIIYQTGIRIVTGSFLVGIAVSAIMMLVLWTTGMLEKSLIPIEDAVLSLIFLMGARLSFFYMQLYEALYRCKHCAATSTNFLTLEGFVRIGVGVAVLLLGFGIVGFSLSQFIVAIAFNFMYAIVGLKILGYIPKGRWSNEIASDLIKKGLGFMASPIWQIIYFQGSTFIVRIILGPTAVAIFNTIRTLCRSVNQIYNIIGAAILPEMQIAIGKADVVIAQRIFKKAFAFSASSAIMGITFLCLFGLNIYSWWTKYQLDISEDIWYVFMIGIFFNAIWWTSSTVYTATNKPYKFAIYGVISATIAVLLTYILSNICGLIGAVIGYVLMDVLMVLLVFPSACRIMGINWKQII